MHMRKFGILFLIVVIVAVALISQWYVGVMDTKKAILYFNNKIVEGQIEYAYNELTTASFKEMWTLGSFKSLLVEPGIEQKRFPSSPNKLKIKIGGLFGIPLPTVSFIEGSSYNYLVDERGVIVKRSHDKWLIDSIYSK